MGNLAGDVQLKTNVLDNWAAVVGRLSCHKFSSMTRAIKKLPSNGQALHGTPVMGVQRGGMSSSNFAQEVLPSHRKDVITQIAQYFDTSCKKHIQIHACSSWSAAEPRIRKDYCVPYQVTRPHSMVLQSPYYAYIQMHHRVCAH